MTSGDFNVTSGPRRWPSWAIGYAVIVVGTLLGGFVNALTVLHDAGEMGRPLPAWEPAVWEATSGIVLVALAWVPLAMVKAFPPAGERWLGALATHLAATVPFSLIHVGLMVFLRHGFYALMGETYRFGLSADELLYEYRKDLLTYALFAAIFWACARLGGGRGEKAAPASPAYPETFDINEGQRLIRVDRADILSARSCGNYVEFTLADGRQPLMRTTLASVESALADAGFVRTHRSWLVNARHVAEIAAEGSGDYRLVLSGGREALVSRRYPDALAALRGRRSARAKQ